MHGRVIFFSFFLLVYLSYEKRTMHHFAALRGYFQFLYKMYKNLTHDEKGSGLRNE